MRVSGDATEFALPSSAEAVDVEEAVPSLLFQGAVIEDGAEIEVEVFLNGGCDEIEKETIEGVEN